MRLKAILLVGALVLPTQVKAQVRSYQNVPNFSYYSKWFKLGDTAAEEAAYIECNDEMQETHRMLVRKSVDIILEDNPCEVQGFPGEKTARFFGSIHFLN